MKALMAKLPGDQVASLKAAAGPAMKKVNG